MTIRCLTLLTLGLLAAPASAAPPAPTLDPEAATPYQWRVILRFEPHPVFTPAFRRQIADDIKAALQPSLGEVGRVEVTDLATLPEERRDPLIQAFARDGWPALEAVPFRDLTGLKTHFLRLSAVGGRFRLEARQHDGSTGLASPLIRSRETPDAQEVSRHAGLLLARDFGPVGTVEKLPNEPEMVRVRFRGGALPGFDRFVRPGDVFAVAAIQEQTRKVPAPAAPPPEPGARSRFRDKVEPTMTVRVGQPREYTLLRAEEPVEDGACRCRILTRFRDPLPVRRGLLGFRCLKLATVEGPVQLRIVDQEGRPQATGGLLQVRATDADFGSPLDARDALELRNGLFRSPRPLRNVACVVVSLGAERREQFPLPVLGDGPVTIRFEAKPEDAARAAFERACEDLRGRVAEARTNQIELIRALSRLILQGKNREALERATDGLTTLDAADKDLAAELSRLEQQPGASAPLPAALLQSAREQLAAIRSGRGGIEQRVEDLKIAAVKKDDPVRFEREFRAKELTSRIRQLIEQGEVPEALELYDELFRATENQTVQDQKTKLAAEWEPKNDEHRQARQYILEDWRKVQDLPGFEAALTPLENAADVLKKYDDRLGLRNLLSSFEPAYARIQAISDTLDSSSETDRATVKKLLAVTEALRKVEESARERLKQIESAGKAP